MSTKSHENALKLKVQEFFIVCFDFIVFTVKINTNKMFNLDKEFTRTKFQL